MYLTDWPLAKAVNRLDMDGGIAQAKIASIIISVNTLATMFLAKISLI